MASVVGTVEDAPPVLGIDLTKLQSCGEDLYWHGCYNQFRDWRKYVTAESFAHPAKMATGLCDRIFKHLKKLGLLKEDSVVCDFMSGIGTTNIMASLHGYDTISVELEPHFVEMINNNRSRLKRRTGRSNGWQVIQGDARSLSSLLKEKGCVGVVSPPFADTIGNYTHERGDLQKYLDRQRRYNEKISGAMGIKRPEPLQYSTNPSNIGNLPDKPLVGVVSPPYQDAAMPCGCPAHIRKLAREGEWDKAIALERIAESEQVKKGNKFAVSTDSTIRRKIEQALERDKGNYSENPSNIGNLKDKPLVGVISPPYRDISIAKNSSGIDIEKQYLTYRQQGGGSTFEDFCRQQEKHSREYSSNPSNIGNLSDKEKELVGIVSPPFEDSTTFRKDDGKFWDYQEKKRKRTYRGTRQSDAQDKYSDDKNNIGNQQGETYLEAMLQVYKEAYKSGISPLVVVTKNPTRNGELRRLDLDTANLLMQAGYEIIDYHRAVLFEERKQQTLMGDVETIPKGRLSFFKRLSYQKGNIVAQWEDIIIATLA